MIFFHHKLYLKVLFRLKLVNFFNYQSELFYIFLLSLITLLRLSDCFFINSLQISFIFFYYFLQIDFFIDLSSWVRLSSSAHGVGYRRSSPKLKEKCKRYLSSGLELKLDFFKRCHALRYHGKRVYLIIFLARPHLLKSSNMNFLRNEVSLQVIRQLI